MARGKNEGTQTGNTTGTGPNLQDQLDLGTAASKADGLGDGVETLEQQPQVEEDITNPNVHLGSSIVAEPYAETPEEPKDLPEVRDQAERQQDLDSAIEPLPPTQDSAELGPRGEDIFWEPGPDAPARRPVFSSGSPRRGAEEPTASTADGSQQPAPPPLAEQSQSFSPLGTGAGSDLADGLGGGGAGGGAPGSISMTGSSVNENAANGTDVGSIGPSLAGGSVSYTYSLLDDAGGRFAIDPVAGAVTVADGSLLDYETANSHSISVQAVGSDSSTLIERFTINLNNLNEAPEDLTLSGGSVAENAASGTAVGSVVASDPDSGERFTYSLIDDAGGRFAIDPGTGEITVADGTLLDYEAASAHDVTVEVTDGAGNPYTETFTISVGDTEEFDISAVTDSDASANAISEAAANGTYVGVTALATDADATDSVTYSLADDAGGRFAIDPGTGAVTVADGSLLDFETATSHTVTVLATSSDGSTSTESFTIDLADADEFDLGAVTDSDANPNTISEAAANGTYVGVTALASDPDATDSVTYSLADDAGGRFAIDRGTGAITVADGSLLDFETATSHTVTVLATSSDGSTATESFTIGVDDANEAPTDILFGTSIDEHAPDGTLVDVAVGVDPDAGDSLIYALTDDAGGRFVIDPGTGAITVADSARLDHESATSHDITVRVTDSGGLSYTETFTIAVNDVNEAPTVTTSAASGDEDTTIPLSITLGNLEPGATQSVLITGVPAGAVLSAGSDNGDGTWTLTPAQLDGLTVTPPQHSDVDFQLTVTAASDDGSTVETSAPQTIDVTLHPVADSPNLTATGTASGSEDGSVQVNAPASILALDGNPGLVVTVSDVPTGATLSAGRDNGDGTWTLGSGQLANLIVTPPAGDASSFTLAFSAIAPAQENPVNQDFSAGAGGFTYTDDAFRGTNQPGYATGSWGGAEGQSGGGLLVELGGVDNADINGMSGGFSTSFTVTETSTGSLTFSYRMQQARPYDSGEVSQVLVSIDGTLIGQGGNDYIARLEAGGDTGWQTVTLDLGALAPGTRTLTLGGYNNLKTYRNETTEIRFDNVDLTLDTTTTVTGSDTIDPDFVTLDIAASLVDTDGSESLTVVISGVPAGAALSAGSDNGDGTWTLGPADLPGLTLFPPEDFSGSFQLTVTATATDGSDTASAVETIDVTVSYLNEPPVSNDSGVSAGEDTTVTFGFSDFSFTDVEGDSLVEVEITTLPSEGSLLLNGVAVSAGDRISAADINAGSLTFEPAADSDADPSFTFRVSDGAHFSATPATMTIAVAAVADAPSLILTDAVADSTIAQSTFETGDTAGSFINGTVDGWSPSAGHQIETWHESEQPGRAIEGEMFIEINNEGSSPFPDAGSIERTISTTADTPYELSFQVSPRPGFESYMDFQVRVVDVSSSATLKTLAIDWDGSTVSRLTWTEHSISFLGTGGDVRLVMEDVGAVHREGRGAFVDDIRLSESSGTAAGSPIALSSLIAVSLIDTDGSESLDPIEIAGIPEGFLLESGGSTIAVVDGAAAVTPAQLSGLTLTSPEGFTGNVDLSVTATANEAANGDSASTTDRLTIDIVANDENLDSLGLAGKDTLDGDASDNTIHGGAGSDTLSGNSGADTLFGGSGDDVLNGGGGTDVLLGGDGDDSLSGGLHNDLLQGGTGEDALEGGSGVDAIFGGAGDDTLDGGAGSDRLYGEGGNDLFIFAEGSGNDLVSGGQGGGWTDVIQLRNAAGGTPGAGWTYVLDQGSVESSGADFIDLSEDAAGTITLADGSEVAFEGIERIEW